MNTTKQNSRRQRALADALAGVIASLVSLWSFYPIETLKTNIQANRINNAEAAGLYRGITCKTLHTASSSFCYFYIYSWISSRFNNGSTIRRLVLSAVAAMLNTCLTLPLDVLSAKQQTGFKTKMDQTWNEASRETSTCLDESDENDENVLHQDEKKDDSALSESPPKSQESTHTENESLTHLWKGLYPSLLLCSNPSIHFTVFDSIKSKILKDSNHTNLTMPQAFVVGLVAKFVATIATYPLIRTKVLLMVTSQTSIIKCLSKEYREHGVRGWYRACLLQLFHTLLKSALLMMVRERITVTTRQLLVSSENNS
mmetsp:Transcript_28946/g.52382  ORF Transcript_28946/g.52382 Transcript_28946/m.52382 type:complete len:314 (+) Transcript_28946:7-948(+)